MIGIEQDRDGKETRRSERQRNGCFDKWRAYVFHKREDLRVQKRQLRERPRKYCEVRTHQTKHRAIGLFSPDSGMMEDE